MESSEDAPRPAPEHYGRYRLIERIGRGGMAEVFRAYVDGLEAYRDTFVIKRIRPDKSDVPEIVQMFCDEARICALLDHPNIVQVYDFGQVGGAYFLAMEYLRGRDLAVVMRALRLRLGAVPPAVAARVAQQAALGLQHAHEAHLPDGRPADIVHRDVTPSNIMLLTSGGVKVLDFGIAKVAALSHAPVPAKRRVKGKLAYLSPEQVRSLPLDGRSDVFSLGVVLWEMLAGQRLFAATDELSTVRNVVMMPIPTPSSKRREVPPALDAIVARALEREPDARYPSAGAMADELERALRAMGAPAAEARLDPDAGIRRLMAELFGEGAPAVPERTTTTFSVGTFSSLDSAPELPPVDAPAPPRAAPGRRAAPIAVALLLAVGLALVVGRALFSRAAPDPSRPAGTATGGT
jgi:serine/threonine-protein kinase